MYVPKGSPRKGCRCVAGSPVTYRTSSGGVGGGGGGGGGSYGHGDGEGGLRAGGRRRFFIPLISDDSEPRTITVCRTLSSMSMPQRLHAHSSLASATTAAAPQVRHGLLGVSSAKRHGASTFSLLAEVPLIAQPRRRNLRLRTVSVPLGTCRAQRKFAVRVSSTLRSSPVPRSLTQYTLLLSLTMLLILTISSSVWPAQTACVLLPAALVCTTWPSFDLMVDGPHYFPITFGCPDKLPRRSVNPFRTAVTLLGYFT